MDKANKQALLVEELAYLRIQLAETNKKLGPVRTEYLLALSNYERAFRNSRNLQLKCDKIDRKLAESDGRTKKLRSGGTGKPKSKGGDTKLDLKAYLHTLSPKQREDFMSDLLKP